MVTDLINEFRIQNGKEPFYDWNSVENQYCELHCFHMSRIKDAIHAPDYLLGHRGEACARHYWDWDLKHTVSKIIWEQFANSPGHKAILLKDNLAYAVTQDNWMVYLTIRGW